MWGWTRSGEEGWEAAPWSVKRLRCGFVETDGHGLRIEGSDAVAQHAVGGGGGGGGRTRGAEGGGSPPEGSGAAGVVGRDARLKAPRRRGRDQRGTDGVIELALEQGVGGRFQGSSSWDLRAALHTRAGCAPDATYVSIVYKTDTMSSAIRFDPVE
jgi:hypothetical protein